MSSMLKICSDSPIPEIERKSFAALSEKPVLNEKKTSPSDFGFMETDGEHEIKKAPADSSAARKKNFLSKIILLTSLKLRLEFLTNTF